MKIEGKLCIASSCLSFANSIGANGVHTPQIWGASSCGSFSALTEPFSSAGDHQHAADPAPGSTAGAEGGCPAAQGGVCRLPEGQGRSAEAGSSFLPPPQPFPPQPTPGGQGQATEISARVEGCSGLSMCLSEFWDCIISTPYPQILPTAN